MAYKFNEEDKIPREFKDRLPYGISEVQFVLAEAGETEAGKDYIAVTVQSQDGIEEEVRLWFVGGAAPISWNTLRDIAVHNADTEEGKEAARAAIDSAIDTEQLAGMLNENTIGGQLWYTRYQDPTRTYTGTDGKVRKSVNTNLYGYEPKLREDLMPSEERNMKPSDYPDDDFTKDVAGKEVPFESKGDAAGSKAGKGWA